MNRTCRGPSKQTVLVVSLISYIAIISFFRFPFSNSSPLKPPVTNSKMVHIVHIVMFEFKEEATVKEIADVRYSDPK